MKKQTKLEYEEPMMRILSLRLEKDIAGVTMSEKMVEDEEIPWETTPSSTERNAFNF
jgi:hypothetical protein